MQISITARHHDLTNEERAYAEEKFGRMDRIFQGIVTAEVILKEEDRKCHCEVILHAKGKNDIVVDVARDEILEAIDVAVDKVERQLRRAKEKMTAKRRKTHHDMRPPVAEESVSEEVEEF